MLSVASPSMDRQRQFWKFYILIPMYLLIFTTRSIWNILYYAGVNPIQDIISGFIRRHEESNFDWAFLVFYSFFELFPQAVVVYIFTSKLLVRRAPDGSSQGYDGYDSYYSPYISYGSMDPAKPVSPLLHGPDSMNGLHPVSNSASPLSQGRTLDSPRWNVDALDPLTEDS